MDAKPELFDFERHYNDARRRLDELRLVIVQRDTAEALRALDRVIDNYATHPDPDITTFFEDDAIRAACAALETIARRLSY